MPRVLLFNLLLYVPVFLFAQSDTLFQVHPFTQYTLTASEIQQLPVRGLQNYLNLLNGVVIQDGNVHIRGGRDDETAYYINGFSSTNPLDNTNAIRVIPEAMQRIDVLTGFFPARYGGINSGLILTRLKRGGEQFHFTVDYQTDKFASAGEQFLNTYSYRDHILTATASGPAYFDNLYFFVALENNDIGDAAKRFSSGFNFENLVDQHWRFRDDVEIEEEEEDPGKKIPLSKILTTKTDSIPDTVSLTYPDGFTPFNSRETWNVNATLFYDLKPFKFDLTLLHNWEEAYNNDRPMLEILNQRQDYKRHNKWLVGFKMNHEVSDRMQYDLSFGYYTNRSEKFDAYFGNNWKLWDDSAAVAQATGGAVKYRESYTDPYDYWIAGFNFYSDGTDPGNYLKTNQNYWSIDANLDWQFGSQHRIRWGVNYRRYTIRQYEMDPDVMYLSKYYNYGGLFDIPPTAFAEFAGNTYGYNYLGNEIDSGFDGPRKPVFAAMHIEDSFQLNDILINLGLRYDYIASDDYTLKDFRNINYDWRTGYIAEDNWKEKAPVHQISPRIAILYQSDSGNEFYLNYGKYIQLPKFNLSYYNSHTYFRQIFRGGFFFYTPAGVAPEPIYSTQYEIGYRRFFRKQFSASITAYYKKTSGLPNIEEIRIDWYDRYWTIGNDDFSVVKGIEFNFGFNRIKRLYAQLYYSLTWADGTGSTPLSYYNAVFYGRIIPTAPYPLDYNQRHRLSLILDYRFGSNEGGIFKNSGVNLTSRVSSGHPYTYSAASTFG